MELTAARFPARIDAVGRPVLLEQQNRQLWDQSAIRRGRAALERATASNRGMGAYGLQALIAECHAVAPSVKETDWLRIVLLYEALGRLAPSPVVDVAHAVAVAMAVGPAAGLALVDAVAARQELTDTHLVPSVRGEMLLRLGRPHEARQSLQRAVELCTSAVERGELERKIDEIDGTEKANQ
jgi:predicted RNA polymerase sigma factor